MSIGYFIATSMVLMAALAVRTSNLFEDRKVFLLSPPSVFAFAWAASSVVYCFGDDFLREKTIIALMTFYLSFIAGSSYVMLRFGTGAKTGRPNEGETKRFARVLILCQLLAAVAAAAHLYYAWQQAGAGATITQVRGVLANQTIETPIAFRFLGQLRYLNYVAPLAILSMRRSRFVLVLSVLLACAYPILDMERSGVMRIGLLLAFAYVFSARSWASIAKMAVVGAVLGGVLVVAIPIIRGQPEGANAYQYVAGAWAGFDDFVAGTDMASTISTLDGTGGYVTYQPYQFGNAPMFMMTATDLYGACHAIGLCSAVYVPGTEYVNDPWVTNIYTMARSFYQDFGLLGSAIATALFSAGLTLMYLYGFGRGAFGLYVSAYTAYVCIMSVLANNFLMRDIVLTAALYYGLRSFSRRVTLFPLRIGLTIGSSANQGSIPMTGIDSAQNP